VSGQALHELLSLSKNLVKSAQLQVELSGDKEEPLGQEEQEPLKKY